MKNNFAEQVQYKCTKDQLTKFANAENTNNPNLDKKVAELREKLRSLEIIPKEMEATLTKLKKSKRDNKGNSTRISNRNSEIITRKESVRQNH